MNDNEPIEIVNKKSFFGRFWWIFLIVLLLVGTTVYYFFFYNKTVEEEKTKIVDNGVNLPNDIEIKEFSSESSSFYYYCLDSKSDSKTGITSLKSNMEVDCYLSYSFSNKDEYKVSDIYFELDNGKEINISDIKTFEENKLLNENNKYKLTIKNPNHINDKILNVSFSIGSIDNISSSDLYINIKNLVFRTTNDIYYRIDKDIKKDFTIQSVKYKFYNCNGNLCMITPEMEKYSKENGIDLENEDYIFLSEYQCKTKNCEFINTDYEQYALLEDGEIVLFDYRNNKTTKLTNFVNKYSYYEFAKYDDKLYAILCENSDDYKKSYYLISQNKYIVKDSESFEYYSGDDFIKICDDQKDSCNIYTLEGKEYQYDIKKMKRIDNSPFYYKELCEGTYILANSNNKIYNKGFSLVVDGTVDTGKGIIVHEYGIDENNNLILSKGSYFVVLDENFETIFTSENYYYILTLIHDKILAFDNNKIFFLNSKGEIGDTIIDFGDKNTYSVSARYDGIIHISMYNKDEKKYLDNGKVTYKHYFYEYDTYLKKLTEISSSYDFD